jgi:adenosylhomocysteine nucleosidase
MAVVARLLLALILCVPLAAKAGSDVVDVSPRIALLAAYQPEWDALRAIVEDGVPSRQSGVEVITGQVEGHPVLLVRTGISMVNASLATQMMIDRFNLTAILFCGIAGAVDPGLNIGDVVVAERWAEYLEIIMARATPQGFKLPPWAEKDQVFANFEIMFPRPVEVSRDGQDRPAQQFWFPVDARLLDTARATARSAPLRQCLETVCVAHVPRARVGGSGVSGSAFVDNAEFRNYVFRTFHADLLDMESAAVAHVAATNALPYLAVRALSDTAGGNDGVNEEEVYERLASANAVSVLRALIKAMPK